MITRMAVRFAEAACQDIKGNRMLWPGDIAPDSIGKNFEGMLVFSDVGGRQRSKQAGLFLLNDTLRYQLFEYPVQGACGFGH